MISFINEFEKKATLDIQIQQVLGFTGLDNVRIYLRDGPFSSDIGIVNIYPTKGTHWACFLNENYFDGYGCVCPKKIFKFFIKRNGYFSYSEYQIPKNNSFIASFCLYIIYLTKVVGMVFKSAVLSLCYQIIAKC